MFLQRLYRLYQIEKNKPKERTQNQIILLLGGFSILCFLVLYCCTPYLIATGELDCLSHSSVSHESFECFLVVVSMSLILLIKTSSRDTFLSLIIHFLFDIMQANIWKNSQANLFRCKSRFCFLMLRTNSWFFFTLFVVAWHSQSIMRCKLCILPVTV